MRLSSDAASVDIGLCGLSLNQSLALIAVIFRYSPCGSRKRPNHTEGRDQEMREEGTLEGRLALARSRDTLFHETPLETLERVTFGIAWALKVHGVRGLTSYWRRWLSEYVVPQRFLPEPERPFDGHARVGLVHDLSVPTLVAAYKRGLFTAGHFGTLAWMSPPQRCVLFLNEYHIAKRLRRLMRQGHYTVTFDRDFEGVINACAGRRLGRWHVTWITPRIKRAYAALYDEGYVHSFEVWNTAGALVGGGYGVALGRIFFTESQFSHEANTSKLGFSVLN